MTDQQPGQRQAAGDDADGDRGRQDVDLEHRQAQPDGQRIDADGNGSMIRVRARGGIGAFGFVSGLNPERTMRSADKGKQAEGEPVIEAADERAATQVTGEPPDDRASETERARNGRRGGKRGASQPLCRLFQYPTTREGIHCQPHGNQHHLAE